MGFAKKHPLISGCLLIPVFMVMCLAAFLAPAAIQNYRGVCLSEGRILTDEEKLERAIQHIIERRTLYAWVGNNFHTLKVERYKNAETFLRENPGCCRLNPKEPLGVPAEDFLDRISGFGTDTILLIYKVLYYDQHNELKSLHFREENTLSNCGKLQYDRVANISP